MLARRDGRARWALVLLLCLVVGAVGPAMVRPPAARGDTGRAYQLAAQSTAQVGKRGETFFTTDVQVTYAAGESISLAGDPTGKAVFTVGDYSGNVYVDDAMDITVLHPDGTLQRWSNEWTFDCLGLYPSGPVGLGGLFQPGKNLLRISLRDRCGTAEGSSPLFLIGDAAVIAGPGDSPQAAAVLGDGWRYHFGSSSTSTDFAAPDFDDSSWTADTSPLWIYDEDGPTVDCPLLGDSSVYAQPRAAGSDVTARTHVRIPSGASEVTILALVAGRSDVYWNGERVAQVSSSCRSMVAIPVPAGDVGADDVVAFRSSIAGAGTYGFEVSYVPPGATVRPRKLGVSVEPMTPSTPLYTVPLTVSLPVGTACPSRLDLSLGAVSTTLVRKSVKVCGGSGSAPGTVHVDMPVFDAKTRAVPTPGQTVDVAVSLTGGADASTSTRLPRAPVWVGVGDSYTSGHHQKRNALSVRCNWPLLAGVQYSFLEETCHTYPNDPGFSWVTGAVDELNHRLSVPKTWRMTAVVAGLSGASTADYDGGPGSQVDVMTSWLSARPGSWNIVSTTGGADDGDYTFAAALQDWYGARLGTKHLAASKAAPWKASWPDCPDIERIWQTASAETNHIATNLLSVYRTATATEPATRFVDVDYPFVLPPKKKGCASDYVDKKGLLHHGATSAIDVLDDVHRDLSYPGLTVVDMRGRLEFKDIQQTLLLGFPHATAKGQDRMARQALDQLRDDLNAY